MDPLMQLVVGWTLVGGFVFTVVVTCLSLVGWVKFADPAQQKKLFQVLIVELVVGVGGKALDLWRFDPEPVGREIFDEGQVEGGRQVGAYLFENAPEVRRNVPHEVVIGALESVKLREGTSAERRRAEMVEGLSRAQNDAAFSRAFQLDSTLRVRDP